MILCHGRPSALLCCRSPHPAETHVPVCCACSNTVAQLVLNFASVSPWNRSEKRTSIHISILHIAVWTWPSVSSDVTGFFLLRSLCAQEANHDRELDKKGKLLVASERSGTRHPTFGLQSPL